MKRFDLRKLPDAFTEPLFCPKPDAYFIGALSALTAIGGAVFVGLVPATLFAGGLYVGSAYAYSPSKRAWSRFLGRSPKNYFQRLHPKRLAIGAGVGLTIAAATAQSYAHQEWGVSLQEFYSSSTDSSLTAAFSKRVAQSAVVSSYVCATVAAMVWEPVKYMIKHPKQAWQSVCAALNKKEKKIATLENLLRRGASAGALHDLAQAYFSEGRPDEALGVYFDTMHVKKLPQAPYSSLLPRKHLLRMHWQGRPAKELLVRGLTAGLEKESIDVLVDRAYQEAKHENDISTLAMVGFYKKKICLYKKRKSIGMIFLRVLLQMILIALLLISSRKALQLLKNYVFQIKSPIRFVLSLYKRKFL